MGFNELLKAQGLTDEQIAAITGAMKENKIYTTTIENVDEEYNKIKGENDDLAEQIKTANKTIADLKKNNADNEALQKTIADHEATIKTQKEAYEEKIKNMTFDTAIKNWLVENNAKHPNLISKEFDKSKLVLKEDGSVEGIDTQGEEIKSNFVDLFGKETGLKGRTPSNPPSAGIPGEITKEQFEKMGYLERTKLHSENPALYESLRGE